MSDLRIRIIDFQYVRAGDILPNPDNWRVHNKAQIDAYRAMVESIGYAGAQMVFKTDDGDLMMIDGHMRQTEHPDQLLPTLITDLNAEEASNILATFDPISAMADANRIKLKNLHEKLAELKTDTSAARDAVLKKIREANGVTIGADDPPDDPGAQIDKAAELQEKWQVKRGDIWQVGKHRIMCGDSTYAEDVERLMGGVKADAVVTDPPYGMNLQIDRGHYSRNGDYTRQYHSYSDLINDESPFDRKKIIIDCVEEFWFGADYYVDTLDKFGKCGSWLVWNKRAEGGNEKMQGSMFELIWSKQKHRREILHFVWNGVLGHVKQIDGNQKYHPTQKSTKMIMYILKKWCGDLIVDPFIGSGTTLVACEQTGRIGYGMEISEPYVAVCLERLAGIGLEPRLLNS
ncbi:site-specific DNA-methyltransferase [Candidatus Pacearchaeota archaeon]|nr:site-specific DNA-methyltransferase [Candidatus Pacearchaeota archaeon]